MSDTISITGDPSGAIEACRKAQAAIDSLKGKTVRMDIDWNDPASVERWASMFEEIGLPDKAADLRRRKAEYDARKDAA